MRSKAMTARTIWIAAALSALMIAGPALVEAAQQIESRAAQITIDGDPGDWTGIPGQSLDKSLPMIAVAHDDSYLYLMYRFDDQGLARQLSYHGLILWLNGDGKTKNKHEQYGVRYGSSQQIEQHLEGDADDGGEQAEPAATRNDRDRSAQRPGPRHSRHRPHPGEVTVIRMGLKKIMAEQSEDGLAAASAVHGDTFCYELRIPLADIGGKVADTPAKKVRRVALGIQIAGLTEAERMIIEGQVEDEDMPVAPPSSSPMMGSSPSPSLPGGFMPGHAPAKETSFKAKIEWLKISLPPGAGSS